MIQEKEMRINVEIEKRALRSLLEAANAFYENPANRQAFEAWEKSEEGKQYATSHTNT